MATSPINPSSWVGGLAVSGGAISVSGGWGGTGAPWTENREYLLKNAITLRDHIEHWEDWDTFGNKKMWWDWRK